MFIYLEILSRNFCSSVGEGRAAALPAFLFCWLSIGLGTLILRLVKEADAVVFARFWFSISFSAIGVLTLLWGLSLAVPTSPSPHYPLWAQHLWWFLLPFALGNATISFSTALAKKYVDFRYRMIKKKTT